MPEGDHLPGRLCFGVFEVDLRGGELRKYGLRIRLQAQAFQVLTMLLERPGEVVNFRRNFGPQTPLWISTTGSTKRSTRSGTRWATPPTARALWKLSPVAATGSSPRSSPRMHLRTALGPSTRVFSTVPGHPDIADKPATPKRFSSSLVWTTAIIVALMIVLAAWMLRLRTRPSPVIHSVAVLPLESLSGDAAQDYFADGMTDELITDLGKIGALSVISRTSVMLYKKVRKPLPTIARELGVDAVVEGTVLRSGDRVRITAQLIQASADKHLWAQSYEGDLRDTLTLQRHCRIRSLATLPSKSESV